MKIIFVLHQRPLYLISDVLDHLGNIFDVSQGKDIAKTIAVQEKEIADFQRLFFLAYWSIFA